MGHKAGILAEKWRTRGDSNARLSAPEADALSTELRVRRHFDYNRSTGTVKFSALPVSQVKGLVFGCFGI